MFRDKESFGRIICELSLVNERCSLNCRFGARYKFDAVLNVFTFFEGEDLEVGKIFSEQVLSEFSPNLDLVLKVEYPETVFLVNGSHPEVFSANGSHGIWAVEGGPSFENKGPVLQQLLQLLVCYQVNNLLSHRISLTLLLT